MEGEEEEKKEGGEGVMCVQVAEKRRGVYLAMRKVATSDDAALLHVGLAEVGALLLRCAWMREGSWRRRDGEER